MLKRILAERKIIIISENNVRNIPLCSRTQMGFYALLFGFFCWVSYSSGMYMAHQHVLESKEQQLAEAERKNDEMAAQFSLLQKDVQHMMEAGGGKNREGYDNFLATLYSSNTVSADSDSPLMQRINYLESRVHELENYQQSFLALVEDSTSSQIDKIRKVIDLTGLSTEAMAKASPYKAPTKEDEAASEYDVSPDAIKAIEEQNDGNSNSKNNSFQNQGGPFVSANITTAASNQQDHEKEVAKSVSELVNLHTIYESLPIGLPVKGAHVTSTFGARRDPITHRQAVHLGTDLSAPADSKIFATAPGKVVYAGRMGAYGNLVEIDHGFGLTSRYGHMKEISVKVGDTVNRGDNIGIQGSTGRSTGMHLHYEVRFNNRPVNPQRFINAGVYAEEKRFSQNQQ